MTDYSPGEMIPGTDIELRNTNLTTGKIKYAVLDFDGTVSLLRRGWEQVMIPFMVECVSGGKGPVEGLQEAAEKFVDETTGIQTILQMEGMAEMIRTYGLAPESEIKDPFDYKQEFNRRLMLKVTERINQAENGEVPFSEQIVPGANDFLTAMFHQGIVMYVTSGTDRTDVRREAEILNVAHYFEGRIYGALRSVQEYSKEKVIKEIISLYGLQGPQLVVIGDGPVEIKNGNAAGAITVGVATDEYERQGINPRKRERLLNAGADIIIPDFRCWKELMAFLFEEGK